MKAVTAAVAVACFAGASAFAPVSSFNGASLTTATRSSEGVQMVFGKKKAAAAAPAAPAKSGRTLKPSLPGKKQVAEAKSAAAAAPKKAAAAVKQVQKAAPAAVKKAAAPIQRAARNVAPPAPAANSGSFAVAFGSDVEAPFWDPAKLSVDKSEETLDWYRSAELKHGRVAMLAALGTFINAAGVALPDSVFQGTTKSFDALAKVADERPGALIQVVLAIAAIEVLSIQLPEGEFPGDLGFDPANQKPVFERQGKFDELRLKELKNGRLAMMGIMGMWVQEALTGQGVFEQLTSGHLSPVGDGQGYF